MAFSTRYSFAENLTFNLERIKMCLKPVSVADLKVLPAERCL